MLALHVERSVRPVFVVMLGVRTERHLEMSLRGRQQAVQTLRANATHPSLRNGVSLRNTHRSLDNDQALAAGDLVEHAAELGVPIVEQEAEALAALIRCHREVARLLGRPGSLGVRGHTSDAHASAQQAVEKLIKAVLAARGVGFIKSHALSYLVGVVEENEIEAPEALSGADVLSPWAVEFRYEGEEPPTLDRSTASHWWSRCGSGPRTRSKPQITRSSPSNNKPKHLYHAEVRTSIKSGSFGTRCEPGRAPGATA